MSKFSDQLELLEESVAEEDQSQIETVITEMLNDKTSTIESDDFLEFLSLAGEICDPYEVGSMYDCITEWALSKYHERRTIDLAEGIKFAEAITSWLNHKLETVGEQDAMKEQKIAQVLFADIVNNPDPSKEDDELTNDYQGYATFSLEVGLSEKNSNLVDEAIRAQRKVLELYRRGDFPDYYNLDTLIAGAKRALASTLMDAYEFDSRNYSKDFHEIDDLLTSANDHFRNSDSDFEKKYTLELLKKYASYKQQGGSL